jgi:undecaprenyl-diphosphatase
MRALGSFDVVTIHYINEFARRSRAFDGLIATLGGENLLVSGTVVALFWWAWFREDRESGENREHLIFGFFSGIFAVFLARILALSLPFRERPLRNPLLHFQIPYQMNPDMLIGWSSFPSDHAALFFCLAATVWIASRRLGAVAFCFVFCFICFPRIYLGIHYPSDIIAGAALGMGVAFLSRAARIRKSLTWPMMYWMENYPGSFNAFLFLTSLEMADKFDSLRRAVIFGFNGIEHTLQAIR